MTFMILYGMLVAFLPRLPGPALRAEPWAIGTIIASASLTTALLPRGWEPWPGACPCACC
jgi:hypothetical protein